MVQISKSRVKLSSKWESVKKGAIVQRLWRLGEWPQIAVLKLSAQAFDEFTNNPAKFINGNKLFPAAVQTPAGPGASLIAKQGIRGAQIVIIIHKRASRAPWVSIPEDGPE
jgi:hypothetical protein